MQTGRPKAELKLSPQEQAQLSSLAASRSLPHALVARAKLVLWAAAGASNSTIAQRLSWSLPTVGKWRQRFVEQRVAGLHDELRPGRPRSYGDEQVAGLINRVLHSKPEAATQWSVRSVAEQTGISKSTVARYFTLLGLQPHRSKNFKLSTDPFFVEKVRDVVGLYLNPPRSMCSRVGVPEDLPLMRVGSIKSSAGSRSSPSRRSGAGRSAACANWCTASTNT